MLKAIIGFLVLLNPFALYVYLQPVSRELATRTFMKVLIRASLMSLAIFTFFAYSGDYIFSEIIQIRFEAFRIFGGVVFFIIAVMYIVHGRKALIEMREDLHDLASEIALPFMVGAGTISYSVIIGHKFLMLKASLMLLSVMVINAACIYALIFLRTLLAPKMKIAFDKTMGMSMRLIGFFVGAIGVDMIITGINNLYFS
jgi:multiple antibiotic resistance protein